MPNFECDDGYCERCGADEESRFPRHTDACNAATEAANKRLEEWRAAQYHRPRKTKDPGSGLTYIWRGDVASQVGKIIHLDWAGTGPHWRLVSVQGDRAILETPKTGKRRETHVKHLCYTRRNEPKD